MRALAAMMSVGADQVRLVLLVAVLVFVGLTVVLVRLGRNK